MALCVRSTNAKRHHQLWRRHFISNLCTSHTATIIKRTSIGSLFIFGWARMYCVRICIRILLEEKNNMHGSHRRCPMDARSSSGYNCSIIVQFFTNNNNYLQHHLWSFAISHTLYVYAFARKMISEFIHKCLLVRMRLSGSFALCVVTNEEDFDSIVSSRMYFSFTFCDLCNHLWIVIPQKCGIGHKNTRNKHIFATFIKYIHNSCLFMWSIHVMQCIICVVYLVSSKSNVVDSETHNHTSSATAADCLDTITDKVYEHTVPAVHIFSRQSLKMGEEEKKQHNRWRWRLNSTLIWRRGSMS